MLHCFPLFAHDVCLDGKDNDEPRDKEADHYFTKLHIDCHQGFKRKTFDPIPICWRS